MAATAMDVIDPAAGRPLEDSDDIRQIRESVQALCADYPGEYWREKDRERQYPTEFVRALTEAGFLAVLIPEEYGGSGLGTGAAAVILEEVHASGGNGAACHAQMYIMGTILRHGSDAIRSSSGSPESPAANSASRRSGSPSRRAARTLWA